MKWTDRIGRRLKLNDLHILMIVAESGSMGKAAKTLGITQPSVSKAISDIEHTIGVRLLDRVTWHGAKTQAGSGRRHGCRHRDEGNGLGLHRGRWQRQRSISVTSPVRAFNELRRSRSFNVKNKKLTIGVPKSRPEDEMRQAIHDFLYSDATRASGELWGERDRCKASAAFEHMYRMNALELT
jgi:hypothetical protein